MSDVHYVSYDPSAMWIAMLETYAAHGGDMLYPGDEKEMLMRAVQAILVQAYAAIDHAARMRTLRYAVGEYLDLIGENRGVNRIQAAKAYATVSITLRGNGAVTAPSGTLFTFDGIQFFELETAATGVCAGGECTVDGKLICTQGGVHGNGLIAQTVLKPVTQSANILRAVLLEATTGGRDSENDDSYRTRIRNSRANNATTGPASAYIAKTLAVSAFLLDVGVERTEESAVALYLLFPDGTDASVKENITKDVIKALDGQEERPLSDLVTVTEAAIVPYALSVGYRLPEQNKDDTAKRVAEAVKDYTAWQDNHVGRAFDPYKLLSLLYSAGAERVQFLAESNVNGGEVVYTPMGKGQALRGTVMLTVDTTIAASGVV